MKPSTTLEQMSACNDAIEWIREYKTKQEAWDKCERGDWMLWYLGKKAGSPQSQSRKELVLIACKCARLSLKYVPKSEKRPLKAIQTAEKWAKSDKGVTLIDVRNAAYAAAAADAADAAAYAAFAAAYAAYAAYSAYAGNAAAYASYAAYAAAKKRILKRCANIVRKMHPTIS